MDIESLKARVAELEKSETRVAELEATNLRLLNESKDNKQKASEYRAKLEEKEKAELEKSGDLKAQLEHEKRRAKELEEADKRNKNRLLEQNIRRTLEKVAKDAHNIDDFMHLPEYREAIKRGVDPETLTFSEDAAKELVNKVFTDRPHFKKTIVTEETDTTKPKAVKIDKPDLSKLTAAEIKAEMKALAN